MEDLIKALQIFLSYKNVDYPTHCEHDVMYICGFDKDDISVEDQSKLDKLGFIWSDSEDTYMSYRFGSA